MEQNNAQNHDDCGRGVEQNRHDVQARNLHAGKIAQRKKKQTHNARAQKAPEVFEADTEALAREKQHENAHEQERREHARQHNVHRIKPRGVQPAHKKSHAAPERAREEHKNCRFRLFHIESSLSFKQYQYTRKPARCQEAFSAILKFSVWLAFMPRFCYTVGTYAKHVRPLLLPEP